ncbi:MAG: DUF2125 domain-containing protein [Alphaproteobacteria bacterium]|nr:DUF2125 domain-containing protein [Alphaproteobacteria bacterium]
MVITLIVLLLVAAGWSGFWFYAASQTATVADAWAAKEAQSGRVYNCASRSISGFPFSLEILCSGVNVSLTAQAANRRPFTARLDSILIQARLSSPTSVTVDFDGPALVTDDVTHASFYVTWSQARAVAGMPTLAQRASILFDNLTIDRVDGTTRAPIARAAHVELRGAITEDASSRGPAIDMSLDLVQGTIQDVHPLLLEPFDAELRARVTGLTDIRPKPWPQRFREIQAAGGHLEIMGSRLRQADTVAVTSGLLNLTPSGHLDGEMQVTVAGLERILPALGLDKMLEQREAQRGLTVNSVPSQDGKSADGGPQDAKVLGALDRAIPGLGRFVSKNANVGVMVGINLLGRPAELEGHKARTLPLRFVDGAVNVGPLRVAQTPPLF